MLRRIPLLFAAACAPSASSAFRPAAPHHHHAPSPSTSIGVRRGPLMAATASVDTDAPPRSSGGPSTSGACYYKRADGPWRPRKELGSLAVGERLFATRLPGSDLLNAKTGPKVFLECGIGRKDDKGRWCIVNAMVRLGRRGMKSSVIRKKIRKLHPSELVEVYVSRVSPEEGRLEVCLTRDEAVDKGARERKIPASSLEVGEELAGVVRKVTPYGVFVDVNANRDGLLHISKVAARRDEYIAKEEGLKSVGLGRGAPVNVVVAKKEGKRLEFDLAPEVEESSDETSDLDMSADEAAAWAAYASPDDSTEAELDASDTSFDVSSDEASAWAAYGANDEEGREGDVAEDEAAMWAAYAVDSKEEEDEYDEYDEDADIEDSLGIGSW
ncbi:hypothetical protein ACHAXT_002870 [Thalassiosira profunda]